MGLTTFMKSGWRSGAHRSEIQSVRGIPEMIDRAIRFGGGTAGAAGHVMALSDKALSAGEIAGDSAVSVDAPDRAGNIMNEDHAPRALRHVPDGRGCHSSWPVRRHPAPYRPAQTAASPGMSDGIQFLRVADERSMQKTS